MSETLRVIIDGARDPWLNMAIDEAIMYNRPKQSFDTLRIYTWLPSGVSIGRKQDAYTVVDINEINKLGFKLVRRITGGGALLHEENSEITYSIILSSNHRIYQYDIVQSSALIANGIARGLIKLGIEPEIGGFKGLTNQNLCYLRSGASDITINGKKISGSAQRRESYALLQHGTLLLDFHPETWFRVIKTPEVNIEYLTNKVTCLKNILGTINIRDLIEAIIQGFIEALNPKNVFMSSITSDELKTAIELYYNKYSTPEWNIDGKVQISALIK